MGSRKEDSPVVKISAGDVIGVVKAKNNRWICCVQKLDGSKFLPFSRASLEVTMEFVDALNLPSNMSSSVNQQIIQLTEKLKELQQEELRKKVMASKETQVLRELQREFRQPDTPSSMTTQPSSPMSSDYTGTTTTDDMGTVSDVSETSQLTKQKSSDETHQTHSDVVETGTVSESEENTQSHSDIMETVSESEDSTPAGRSREEDDVIITKEIPGQKRSKSSEGGITEEDETLAIKNTPVFSGSTHGRFEKQMITLMGVQTDLLKQILGNQREHYQTPQRKKNQKG